MREPRYVVMNENTLGYINDDRPNIMGILQGTVLKGGHSWLKGSVSISPSDSIRDATMRDFDEYRVVPPPHFGS